MEQESRWCQQLCRFHEGKAPSAASLERPHSSFLQVWDGEMGHSGTGPSFGISGILPAPEPRVELRIQFPGGMTQRLLQDGQEFPQSLGKPPGSKKIKEGLDHPGCCWSIGITPTPNDGNFVIWNPLHSKKTPEKPWRNNLLWDSKFWENVAGRRAGNCGYFSQEPFYSSLELLI